LPNLQNISNVSISLSTVAVSRQGFGIPLFIANTRSFNERVRTYTTIEAATADFLSGSDELAAATAFFSQIPAPKSVKIGRREADLILTPDTPALDDVYTVTVGDTDGDSVVVSVTAIALDDEEAIVDGLKAAIDGDPNVSVHVTTTKNGTGASATLTISPTLTSDAFNVASLLKLTPSFTSSEVAGDALAAVEAIDSDFYFVTAHDHTETFVLAMALAVEARSKMYFVSSAEQDSIAALAEPATDTLGKLFELNYFRTAGIYHQDADTKFTECAFVGKGAPYNPGTITWANQQLAGVSTSANSGGVKLTATEQNNVVARECNFIQNVGGVDITRQGRVVAGEWIDVIRSRDLLEARLNEAYQNQLINAPKIPYTDSGINSLRSTASSVLSRYVTTETQANILEEVNPFTLDFPRARDVSFADKAARTFNGSFEAFLAGAIHVASVSGSLTYSGDA